MGQWLKSAVVYQIVLRNFTRDGDFRAAARMLDFVRSAGVDAIYLSPFVEMDRDMDERGWSPRQLASGYHTPKNPYRISNYDRIDPEYGGDADFAEFCGRAHALGMRVLLDLVYLHCGPNNVLKDRIPDAFQRNDDGSVRTTQWGFPFLNFGSRALRDALVASMRRWLALGCDGFRCDVGDKVPVDFWEEAAAACRADKPDLVMINEGVSVEHLQKAFDACYALPWSISARTTLCPGASTMGRDYGATLRSRMDAVRAYEAQLPVDALMFNFLDNHDTANDDGEKRFDRVLPVEAGNAAFTLMFLRRGLPMLFSGNEIADNSQSTFFAAVEDIGRARKTVDWARALQPEGKKRLGHIRALAKLRHEDPVFSEGSQEWIQAAEECGSVAFLRRLGGRIVLVAANLDGQGGAFQTGFVPASETASLLSDGGELCADGYCRLGRHGFFVCEVRDS